MLVIAATHQRSVNSCPTKSVLLPLGRRLPTRRRPVRFPGIPFGVPGRVRAVNHRHYRRSLELRPRAPSAGPPGVEQVHAGSPARSPLPPRFGRSLRQGRRCSLPGRPGGPICCAALGRRASGPGCAQADLGHRQAEGQHLVNLLPSRTCQPSSASAGLCPVPDRPVNDLQQVNHTAPEAIHLGEDDPLRFVNWPQHAWTRRGRRAPSRRSRPATTSRRANPSRTAASARPRPLSVHGARSCPARGAHADVPDELPRPVASRACCALLTLVPRGRAISGFSLSALTGEDNCALNEMVQNV